MSEPKKDRAAGIARRAAKRARRQGLVPAELADLPVVRGLVHSRVQLPPGDAELERSVEEALDPPPGE